MPALGPRLHIWIAKPTRGLPEETPAKCVRGRRFPYTIRAKRGVNLVQAVNVGHPRLIPTEDVLADERLEIGKFLLLKYELHLSQCF